MARRISSFRRLFTLVLFVLLFVVGAVFVGWARGLIELPFVQGHKKLSDELRDRGAVAVAGPIPWGLYRRDTRLVDLAEIPNVRNALAGTDSASLVAAMLGSTIDGGLLVRTDTVQGGPGTLLRQLSELRPVSGVTATYIDDIAALYEVKDPPHVSKLDAQRVIDVVRLVLRGNPFPPERLFSPPLRRQLPTEVAVILREGHHAVLWRAVQGSSIVRALTEATYSVINNWKLPQQTQFHGSLREAIGRLSITVAIFHDRGKLGSKSSELLRRSVLRDTYSLGYEFQGHWEYLLPPTPWEELPPPEQAISDLARDHDVPAPGFRRDEVKLYRFRALQLIEDTPAGRVSVDE